MPSRKASMTLNIMKRLIIILIYLCATGMVFAQTPVEKVITKYSDAKGAKDFIASGGEMILARSLIRKTPLAAIASDVEVLEVLMMQKAADNVILDFEKDIKDALQSYEYYGKAKGTNGMVDVYLNRSGKGIIDELVIYNPEIYSVNSLKGTLSTEKLQKLAPECHP